MPAAALRKSVHSIDIHGSIHISVYLVYLEKNDAVKTKHQDDPNDPNDVIGV